MVLNSKTINLPANKMYKHINNTTSGFLHCIGMKPMYTTNNTCIFDYCKIKNSAPLFYFLKFYL